MDTWQILAGANTLLIAILGFFVQRWIKRIEVDIAARTLIVVCKLKHEDIENKMHTHAQSGQAGEVVK